MGAYRPQKRGPKPDGRSAWLTAWWVIMTDLGSHSTRGELLAELACAYGLNPEAARKRIARKLASGRPVVTLDGEPVDQRRIPSPGAATAEQAEKYVPYPRKQ